MSSAEMGPPRPSTDRSALKTPDADLGPAPDTPPTTATPPHAPASAPTDSGAAQRQQTPDEPVVVVVEETRRTRSSGRRTLTCKTCRFTCNNTQEFTHHQNTAHTDEADGEAPSSKQTPTRRLSARHKRALSSPESNEVKSVRVLLPKATLQKTPPPRKPPAAPAGPGESAAQRIPSRTPGADTGDSNPDPSTATTPLSEEDPGLTLDAAREETETGRETETVTETESGCPEPPNHDGDTTTATTTTTMISTNIRPVPRDLDMSGTSEDDEHDLSEEGGRLIIDDSTTAGCGGNSNGSVGGGGLVLPTRCGNIQNRTYMCDECDFTTTSAQQSLHHKKNEHGYDFVIYECNICDYATKYKQKLPRHRKLHFVGADGAPDGAQVPDSMVSPTQQPPSALPLSSPTSASTTPTPNSAAQAPTSAAIATTPPPTPLNAKRTSSEAGFDVTPTVLPSEVILEEGDDDECDDDEMVDSDTPPPEGVEGDLSSTAAVMPPLKKKRKDVSPDKYFEVAEEVASTKYGCAKCGNVYKWKKSLNKHWKEKHGNDPGDSLYTPPGMMILLQQNNHVQTEHRRCCHKTLLERITVKQSEGAGSRTHTPQNFLNGHYTPGSGAASQRSPDDEMDGDGGMGGYLPSIPMGPFVLGTHSQPVFPSSGQRQSLINSLNAPIPSSSVLDLSTHNVDEPDSVDEAAKPLDFSVQKGGGGQHPPAPPPSAGAASRLGLFSGQDVTTEEDEEVSALNQLAASKDSLGSCKDILKCPKCGEVLKTQTAYSNHMAMHLHSSNKRVAKCGVCQTHFPNNEALNIHFMDNHLDLIASHKEAIQKIPHGLQQTYHLLKMPLQNIPKLSSQETEDPLKCNMCDFTAKWPAELQKHAVSHSDERPFVCMVCGSTYKWKWDLVKHFEKAHSNLPNPYKRRDPGGPSATQASPAEAQPSIAPSNAEEGFDMEEGEISAPRIKALPVAVGMDATSSFLFDQANSQDDISVENILRTSQQASLMMSRQPNFLDSPEHTQQSSSSTSPHPDLQGDKPLNLDMPALQGLSLPVGRGVLLPGADPKDDDGSGSRPVKHALAKNIRGRQNGADVPYSSLMTRAKAGSGKNVKSPYKGYRTVEGSESSDLKYQCVLCEYKARWPSEIMQHMKNHSSEKPYGCPNCTYRSKWKWDVVKHLKRCGGGGTIKDVIDYTQKAPARDAPPNVMVTPEGGMVQAQQTASPCPAPSTTTSTPTATPSESAAVQVLQPAALGVSSDSQAALLQPAFPPGGATPALTAQAYINLLYQQLKVAKDTAMVSAASAPPPTPCGPSSSSSSPSPSQAEQGGQGVVYTSVINEGQHHCLHCTFSASSLAELRRHQVLHSDEKPYMCSECSYSTKWKCDMKKHKEKYKHHGPIRHILPNGDVKELDKAAETKKDALEAHAKADLQGASSSKKSPSSHSKFKCKKCPYTTNELVDWISHRHQHQAHKDGDDSRQSPVNGAKEHDEARLKHPRKAVKQYACNKCDFVCLKSTELLEHQKQAHGTHTCPFCSRRCDSKDQFLDHLITHQEFKAKEWEFYFMDDSDNEEDVNNNNRDHAAPVEGGSKAGVSYTDTGSSANTIDLTSATTTTGSPPPHLLPLLHSQHGPADGLPCQWCDARFPNVVRLYQHATQVHPQQKREMEIAEGMAPSPPPAAYKPAARYHQTSDGKKLKQLAPQHKLNDKLASLGVSLLQTPAVLAQLRQAGVASTATTTLQRLAPSPANPEMGLNLSTKKPDSEQLHTFQCIKCTYKTTDFGDYQLHLMMHAPQTQLRGNAFAPSQQQQVARVLQQASGREEMRCWFCGEEQRSFLDVYQHMQDKHPKQLVERAEQREDLVQKIVKEMQVMHVLQREENAKMQAVLAGSLSPANQQASASRNNNNNTTTTTSQAVPSGNSKIPSWLHQKKVLAYKGTPLQGLKLSHGKGDMWYKCLLCNVMDRLPARVAKHTLSVHSTLPQKYQCGHCSHSSKQLQAILQHQQAMHPDMQPDVTVLQFEEITLPIRQPADVSSGASPHAFSPVSLPTKPTPSPLTLQPHAIKQEPLTFSPPRTSSPIQHTLEPIPLDLSADTGESSASSRQSDRDVAGKASLTSEEAMETEAEGPRKEGKTAEVEAQEIMEAEAANQTHGGPADKSLPVLSCKHCPFTTKSSYQFRTHWSCHGVRASYSCDYCTFSHRQLATLTQHRALHSHQPGFDPHYVPKETPPPPPAPDGEAPAPAKPQPEDLQCPDCPYRTSARQAYAIHVGMHGQRLQYVCDLCDWSSDRLVILVQHRNVHADDPDFQESPEDSAFSNPEYAKEVSGEFEAKLLDPKAKQEQSQTPALSPPFKLSITKKLYSCALCPYVTGNRAAYDYHGTLHGGPGCYACEQCSYRTQRWSLLCQHKRLHDEHQESARASSAAGSASKAGTGDKMVAAPLGSKAEEAGSGSLEEGGQLTSTTTTTTTSMVASSEAGAVDEEELETATFPEQEGADSGSPASDYGSLKNEDSKTDLTTTTTNNNSSNPELRCQRCPFSTSSRLLLNQHVKHHSGGGPVVCPCCDYSCPTKENLLVHIQLHFPSMDMDMLQHMLNNLHKAGDSSSKAAPKESGKDSDSAGKKEKEEAPAPSEGAASQGPGKEEKKEGVRPEAVRVYACRYCDREFEDKTLMIQHEHQHNL